MKKVTVTPAFGRDYKSKAAVKADWDADKDFIIASFIDPWCGKPANKSDLIGAGYTHVELRYAKLTKLIMVDTSTNKIEG
jgi:hypothetical protein